MTERNPYANFITAYLARGAVGVSVGLAAVASASANVAPAASAPGTPFAERLASVRSAVSDHVRTAQVLPHPTPPARPWLNWGKAPFSDAWRNVPSR